MLETTSVGHGSYGTTVRCPPSYRIESDCGSAESCAVPMAMLLLNVSFEYVAHWHALSVQARLQPDQCTGSARASLGTLAASSSDTVAGRPAAEIQS